MSASSAPRLGRLLVGKLVLVLAVVVLVVVLVVVVVVRVDEHLDAGPGDARDGAQTMRKPAARSAQAKPMRNE